MSSIMDKLKTNSKVKEADILSDSKLFNNKDFVTTEFPMVNVALSGDIEGGLSAGLTVLAGPSKHFKSSFALIIASAYLKKHKDAVLLFYDSEFGSPQSYFKEFEIDTSRVLHTPVKDIEELKFDIVSQLDNLSRSDKVIVVIDSIGNIASKKELEDAKDGKSVADMSRAKALKGLFRTITPYLNLKNIPMLAINHTYQSMEMYSKAIVSGGCVVKGTKIVKGDGSLINIEDIEVGDEILSSQYDLNIVKYTWNPETLQNGTPKCYEIEFEDDYKVICSEDHQFLVNEKWVMAKELEIGLDCKSLNKEMINLIEKAYIQKKEKESKNEN